MKKRSITRGEIEIIDELEQVIYQGLPLINLVIKNSIERDLDDDQTNQVLIDLMVDGKIPALKPGTISVRCWPKIIILHYERKHAFRNAVE